MKNGNCCKDHATHFKLGDHQISAKSASSFSVFTILSNVWQHACDVHAPQFSALIEKRPRPPELPVTGEATRFFHGNLRV